MRQEEGLSADLGQLVTAQICEAKGIIEVAPVCRVKHCA